MRNGLSYNVYIHYISINSIKTKKIIVGVISNKVDIIVIVETKLGSSFTNSLEIPSDIAIVPIDINIWK